MVAVTLSRDDVLGCVRMQTQCKLPASILRSMYDSASGLFDVSLTGASAAGKKGVQPIRAHKAVLVHASPHLHNLFTAKGYIDSNKSKYTIANIDHDSLCDIVKFIYTDNLELEDDGAAKRVRGILIGAKYLIMTDLVDACEKFLASNDQINVNNCIDLFQFALKYKCLEISSAVCALIANNLVLVSKSTKFLSLKQNECAKFLLSEPVVAASANDRCRAAIAWLDHESPSRAESAECIMSMAALDAAGVKPETLLLAARSPVIRPTIKGVVLALVDAMASNIQRISEVESEQEQKLEEARGEAWYVIGGRDHDGLANETTDFYRYDVARRQWSTLPDLPWERQNDGVCAVGERLIVMGGRKNERCTEDIDEFDTITQTWSTSSSWQANVRAGANMILTADSKHAYVLGGKCDVLWSNVTFGTTFNAADRYCPETRYAEEIASMSAARCGAVAVSKNDEMLFVVGGRVGKSSWNSSFCDTIDKYDCASDTWTTIATLKTLDHNVDAAALLGDDLYMLGDQYPWNVGVFDIRTGQQRVAPKFANSRSGGRVVALNNNVVCVVGGEYNTYDSKFKCSKVVLSSVAALDVREGKWTVGKIVPDMPKASSKFGFARALP